MIVAMMILQRIGNTMAINDKRAVRIYEAYAQEIMKLWGPKQGISKDAAECYFG